MWAWREMKGKDEKKHRRYNFSRQQALFPLLFYLSVCFCFCAKENILSAEFSTLGVDVVNIFTSIIY